MAAANRLQCRRVFPHRLTHWPVDLGVAAETVELIGESRREGISVLATRELLMEPTLAAGHDDLRGLRLDLLRTAAEIYLGLAYPTGVVPKRR